jgi:hypothetical protein
LVGFLSETSSLALHAADKPVSELGLHGVKNPRFLKFALSAFLAFAAT